MIPRLIQSSNLVPLGGTVMTWRDEYVTLGQLLKRVYDQFGLVTGKQGYALDLEYKLMAPGGAVLPEGGLVIKQVRQMPEPNQVQTPFLINTPQTFEVYPGEYYDHETEVNSYSAIVYGRGPIFFLELEKSLGLDTVMTAIQNYYQDNLWGVAQPEDMLVALEDACECELDEIWNEWVYGE